MVYDDIVRALAEVGLSARGGFQVTETDNAPENCATIIMVGNIGPDFWPHFQAGKCNEADPLDAWTKRVVNKVASRAGGLALYPSDGPPYFPFQRWARKTEPVHHSPLGMLIHPQYGLWHAYRAAICLCESIEVPVAEVGANVCLSCEDKPCLMTCPVEAFGRDGSYNVPACAAYMQTIEGTDCRLEGCRARRACPIAGPDLYAPGQAEFHMAAFLKARNM